MTESSLKSTEETAKELRKHLDSSREVFENAAKAIPGRGSRRHSNHHCSYHANFLTSMEVYWSQSR